MSDDDQITLNLENMSSAAMTQARALFDEIVNINTKITIMKLARVSAEEISELRKIRKFMKDRIEYYQSGGKP
jgi:uncharacterized protein YdcH (DUF465 family)